MKKHRLIIKVLTGVIVIALVQLIAGNNNAYGLNLMGPPRSTLQEGQCAIGIEGGYSQMDLESYGEVTEIQSVLGSETIIPGTTQYKIENLKSVTASARLDINVLENMDLFIRIGATDATDEITEVQATDKYKDFDGNFGFSWGAGGRATFYKEGNTTWGGNFQVNWVNPGSSDITNEIDTNFTGNAEISYWEAQLGIGPTVEIDDVRIYGGPFLHFINGDLDINGNTSSGITQISTKTSQTIREKSQVGGFLGAQWNLGNNTTLITEAQITGDGWGIGIGTTWKF
jgi:hypothetical protein